MMAQPQLNLITTPIVLNGKGGVSNITQAINLTAPFDRLNRALFANNGNNDDTAST
jgi:hypothetical protein